MAKRKQAESGFVHLHAHSEFSSLDGACRIRDLPARLHELGMSAMALTDHGVMQGTADFYTTLRREELKPILGIEAYLTENRHDRSRGTETHHLTLLAETSEGLGNLMRLSTRAFLDGLIQTFGYPRPRADYELLAETASGVICLTGCMAGPVMSRLYRGDYTAAGVEVERLASIYGKNNVYAELQDVGIIEELPEGSELARSLGRTQFSQSDANRALARIASNLSIPLVATGDVHYLRAEDATNHDAMICIPTGQTQKGQRRFQLLPQRYHLRSEDEMRAVMGEWPEAFSSTLEIAGRCQAEIQFGKELLPRFPLPAGYESAGTYLRDLCERGLRERLGAVVGDDYRARLEMELGVIDRMGFNDYFLIVWDLFREARERGVPAGPGRGSAAGALVAYTLGITQLDPLRYGLLFERFLNPGRKSMPDIDIDFAQGGRGEMIEYAREKYNQLAGCETAVAQIVTFSRFQSKGALRDSARVLAEPSEEGRKQALALGDRLSRFIPSKPPNISLREAYKQSDDLQKAFKQGGAARDVITLAGWLEGMVRAYSLHAAAVIIADHPLEIDVPLQRLGAAMPLSTQWDMHHAEAVGLLKMDFLGLRNLDVIDETLERIRHTRGVDLGTITDLYRTLPLDDAKTYELFARGETIGLFQFESSGMREALRLVQPTEFTDLIALVALYRPGPMQNIPVYAARKHGREPVTYPDPRVESILAETYGISVYQEQQMLVARELAGFTPADADDLRKAIGKKLRDKMEQLKKPFLAGCERNGVSREVALSLWDDNERAADYSFNKSHAACYAFISYLTGYLKANYPEEYNASLLSSVMGDKDKPRLYLTEAKRMGLRVLPPDVNRSLRDFAVIAREQGDGQDILFGLTALKGVGEAVVREIREERERGGPFTSLSDLVRRMPGLNKATLQTLIRGGALDATGASRKGMFDAVEGLVEQARREALAEEKRFIQTLKNRLASPVDGAQLALTESVGSGRARKLGPDERRVAEALARDAWRARRAPARMDAVRIAVEALEREALRLARAEARRLGTEQLEREHGIAEEEQEQTGNPIESWARAQVDASASERRHEAERLIDPMLAAITAELAEREQEDELSSALAASADPQLDSNEWPELEKLNHERSVLGSYVSGHPLDRDAHKWARYVHKGLGAIGADEIGAEVKVCGAIVEKQARKTKRGDTWFIVTIEDLTGSRDVTVFPKTLEGGFEGLLEVGRVVTFNAKVEEDVFQSARKESRPEATGASTSDEPGVAEQQEVAVRLIAMPPLLAWQPELIQDASPAASADDERAGGRAGDESPDAREPATGSVADGNEASVQPSTASELGGDAGAPGRGSSVPRPLSLRVPAELLNEQWVGELRAILARYPGETPVRLVVSDVGAYRVGVCVETSGELLAELRELLKSSRERDVVRA